MGRRSISVSRGVRMLSADKPLARESGVGNFATRARNGASRILRNVTVCRTGGRGSSDAVMPKADCRHLESFSGAGLAALTAGNCHKFENKLL